VNSSSPNLETVFPGLIEFPVIGTVRRFPPGLVPEVARAAFDAGLRYLEVTVDSDDALGVISELRRHHRGVGVGSVIRVEQVTRAREAGAEFVVSPITNPEVIQASVEGGWLRFRARPHQPRSTLP
jgi:2-dehydro-3-deoxyphosphogluconate aldolase/(4S)-4-hydroxy-2-oxoglutarate aldolase